MCVCAAAFDVKDADVFPMQTKLVLYVCVRMSLCECLACASRLGAAGECVAKIAGAKLSLLHVLTLLCVPRHHHCPHTRECPCRMLHGCAQHLQPPQVVAVWKTLLQQALEARQHLHSPTSGQLALTHQLNATHQHDPTYQHDLAAQHDRPSPISLAGHAARSGGLGSSSSSRPVQSEDVHGQGEGEGEGVLMEDGLAGREREVVGKGEQGLAGSASRGGEAGEGGRGLAGSDGWGEAGKGKDVVEEDRGLELLEGLSGLVQRALPSLPAHEVRWGWC